MQSLLQRQCYKKGLCMLNEVKSLYAWLTDVATPFHRGCITLSMYMYVYICTYTYTS